MNPHIHLSPAQSTEVLKLLRSHLPSGTQRVWVFGSRAQGSHRPNSDLDLLFDPPLPLSLRAKLAEAFEESTLPFEVDLVNKQDLAEEYQEQVNSTKIEIAL